MKYFYWEKCIRPDFLKIVSIDTDDKTVTAMPLMCVCNEDQGAGYTYADEYGECPLCSGDPFIINLDEGVLLESL